MLVAATAHGFGKFRARPFLKRGVGLEVLHTRVKKMPFASSFVACTMFENLVSMVIL